MSEQHRLLILSFSPIASDARVLKQVERFRDTYDVTTCGYGEAPAGVHRHLQIPDDARSDDLNGRYITLRRYRRAYEALGVVRWCRANLPAGDWDVVLANDVEAVPVALDLRAPHGVHADLHEYTPRLHEENADWDRRIRPFWDYVCRRWVSKASSWSTVSMGLVEEYRRNFGFDSVIVTNAAPYADLTPGAVTSPIRLVHSGACLRNRNLMAMVDGVAASTTSATLDLYLMGNDPGYRDELRARAEQTDGRVRVLDPVPYRDLIATLNNYDAGVHILPPTNFNNEWALPNKLFDYVQARLGVIVGPSAEMRVYVEENGLGAVTADFTAESLTVLLDGLTPAEVNAYKAAAHASARRLSSEEQVEIWASALEALLERSA